MIPLLQLALDTLSMEEAFAALQGGVAEAVDVIEALYGYLTERTPCEACVHGHDCPDDVLDCVECTNEHRRDCPCLGCTGDGSKWVWRGPEKEVMQNDKQIKISNN